MEIKISEKNLEDYIITNISKYYPDYKLIDRQVNLGVGVADIVLIKQLPSKKMEGSPAIPKNDVEITHNFDILILELKIGQATTIDVGQLARYVIAIEEIVDIEMFSHNHETHIFEFEVIGYLVSPDIEFDALAMCLVSDQISWQPYKISLETGFELSKQWQFCIADYFDYKIEGSMIKQTIESSKKRVLGLETKPRAGQ